MVSVTLSVPPEIKEMMAKHPEMNWSGFIRKSIEEKTKQLEWRETILKKLEKEKDAIDWSLKLQKVSRSDRFAELKKKGLI